MPKGMGRPTWATWQRRCTDKAFDNCATHIHTYTEPTIRRESSKINSAEGIEEVAVNNPRNVSCLWL